MSGCGLFLTVCFELEHLSEEQELDVMMAVSVVRRGRPQFITGMVGEAPRRLYTGTRGDGRKMVYSYVNCDSSVLNTEQCDSRDSRGVRAPPVSLPRSTLSDTSFFPFSGPV